MKDRTDGTITDRCLMTDAGDVKHTSAGFASGQVEMHRQRVLNVPSELLVQ